MGEYADEIIGWLIGEKDGHARREYPRRCRVPPTAEERRAYAEARHEEMLDDLIDELPGDEEPGQEKGE